MTFKWVARCPKLAKFAILYNYTVRDLTIWESQRCLHSNARNIVCEGVTSRRTHAHCVLLPLEYMSLVCLGHPSKRVSNAKRASGPAQQRI